MTRDEAQRSIRTFYEAVTIFQEMFYVERMHGMREETCCGQQRQSCQQQNEKSMVSKSSEAALQGR